LVTAVSSEGGNWIHELKLDGYRIQAHLINGIGNLYTRNGHEWSNSFPHILNAMEKVKVTNAIFDGEIVAHDKDGKSNFQLLQNSIKSKSDKHLRYYIFDILFLNGRDLRDKPLIERKEILQDLLKRPPKGIIYNEHISEQGEDFFKLACTHKLEGIVSKLEDGPYLSGRNDFWTKTKCSNRQEFVIGGWTDPQGGRKGIGALLLGIYEDKKLRYAGKVGTGFNHQTLVSIQNDLSSIKVNESPFELNSPNQKNVHWVKPVKVCEVSFGNWTDEGILRTPVFLGMREDKSSKGIFMETPKKNSISSPEKILFKKEKISKLEVLNFYKTISKHMIPYLANRPLSLVRCPNGSEGTCFFQKHISGNIPKSFNVFPIKENDGEGDYLSIDTSEGLQELVQLNAFELHSWNCQFDDYHHPDQVVMDFDPGPGVLWKEIVDSAFELKEMLEDINLVSFVKLTGGKGIHVHIPITPVYDWDQVKSFAEALALELVARNPSRFVANMSKKLRTNKIFVDYLRNGYGATAVVPYSLRAKPLSAVALPLEWEELRRTKSSDQYTLVKALRKIQARKRDPWEGMLKLKQKIFILDENHKSKAA
jgi:bifunctional non-homologous end joining protein LigD